MVDVQRLGEKTFQLMQRDLENTYVLASESRQPHRPIELMHFQVLPASSSPALPNPVWYVWIVDESSHDSSTPWLIITRQLEEDAAILKN